MSIYLEQLNQIKQTLLTCEKEEDRKNLESLKQDLEELISLESYDDDKNAEKSFLDSSSSSEEEAEDSKVRHLSISESCLTFTYFRSCTSIWSMKNVEHPSQ